MASEANTKRAQALVRPVGARCVVDILAVAAALDAAEQRGREEEAARWRRQVDEAVHGRADAQAELRRIRSLLAEHDAAKEG